MLEAWMEKNFVLTFVLEAWEKLRHLAVESVYFPPFVLMHVYKISQLHSNQKQCCGLGIAIVL